MRRVWLGLAFAGFAASACLAQTMEAQNTYGGGMAPGLAAGYEPDAATDDLAQEQAEVRAAETNFSLSAGFMHTQYHENSAPGSGDDENGYTEGGTAGVSLLLPNLLVFRNEDFYSAVNFDLSAGNINYGGHYLISNLPADATDRAVFFRVEARLGMGFPLVFGMESIPFLAGGYQTWYRNVENTGQIGTDEQYTTGLLGGGLKLDIPVTPRVVLSGTGEILALFAGNNVSNTLGVSHGLGGSAEERLSFGADYALAPHFHVFGTADWEHFNYAGSKPTASSYYFYEPLSTTTQFGANVGVTYSF